MNIELYTLIEDVGFVDLKPRISIVDKILLWNPCNPWTPVESVGLASIVHKFVEDWARFINEDQLSQALRGNQ